MFGLASGNSITLDMSTMEQLCLFFNAAMSDVEITYVFGGLVIAETETLTFAGETENYTLIVRLFNNSEKENQTRLKCGNAEKCFIFGKFEVKTVLYNKDGFTEFTDMYI